MSKIEDAPFAKRRQFCKFWLCGVVTRLERILIMSMLPEPVEQQIKAALLHAKLARSGMSVMGEKR